MPMSPPKKIAEHFLSNLKTKSNRKRFGFDLKLIKRDLQLYRFNDHNKPYFLFMKVWAASGKYLQIGRK